MESTPPTEAQGDVDESVGGQPFRQLLHAATGDREAEAEALADQSEASTDDARAAVRRVHGDVSEDGVPSERDVATPEDATQAAKSE